MQPQRKPKLRWYVPKLGNHIPRFTFFVLCLALLTPWFAMASWIMNVFCLPADLAGGVALLLYIPLILLTIAGCLLLVLLAIIGCLLLALPAIAGCLLLIAAVNRAREFADPTSHQQTVVVFRSDVFPEEDPEPACTQYFAEKLAADLSLDIGDPQGEERDVLNVSIGDKLKSVRLLVEWVPWGLDDDDAPISLTPDLRRAVKAEISAKLSAVLEKHPASAQQQDPARVTLAYRHAIIDDAAFGDFVAGKGPHAKAAWGRLMQAHPTKEGREEAARDIPLPAPVITLVDAPKLIRETAEYILSISEREVPVAATAGAIMTMSVLTQNRYLIRGWRLTPLNIYLLLLAETGQGKDAVETGPAEILNTIFIIKFIQSEQIESTTRWAATR